MNLNYSKENLRGDVFGGVTAGIVALPLALAFGVQSGLGAIAGLYGAIILGIVAAVLGGTETQISGPTGPMTVVSASVIASAIEVTGSLEAGLSIIVASFVLAGILQVVLGVCRIGQTIRYMPYPVLSGFMSGIGVIIILYQLFPILGHVSSKNTTDILLEISRPLSQINYAALEVGLATIAIIYLFPRLTKAVPSQLIALIVMTVATYLMKLDIPIIANIPEGLPNIKLKEIFHVNPKHFALVVEFASMLAALGAIDSLLTSMVADNMTKTKHDSNRELIGQGIGNALSGLIMGLPGAGATMRTVVNINAGGKTRLSGFIHGVVLLAILLELGKYVRYVPLSVLAGILITVGISIIDYRSLKYIRQIPRTDAVILIMVLLVTVFGNLLHAVAAGMVLACMLFMKQASDLAEEQSYIKALHDHYGDSVSDEIADAYDQYKEIIYIKRVGGPLFFGFSGRFQELIYDVNKEIKVLIIRMEKVPYIDQSGLFAIREVVKEIQSSGGIVLLVGLQKQPYKMIRNTGLIPDDVPESHVFLSIKDCEKWLDEHFKKGKESLEQFVKEMCDNVLNKI